MLRMQCMKTWQNLKTEQNKKESDKDFKSIKSLSALMKVWKDSKNYFLEEMEAMTELQKLLKYPGENPHKTMNKWLMNEFQQTIAEIEAENMISNKSIDPSARTDKKIRKDWENRD